MNNEPVSIVIPTWKGLHLLQRFLDSVLEAARYYSDEARAPVEIIIVDDGGLSDSEDDGSADWLLSQGFVQTERDEPLGNPGAGVSLRLLRNQTNVGFGDSCNRGFKAAASRLVLLLNNDVEIARDAVPALVQNFDDPGVFAVHCRVFDLTTGRECGSGKLGGFSRGFIRVHGSYAVLQARTGQSPGNSATPLYSAYATGGSSMFDRDKFLGLGGFDPLLAPFYWEDVELSYRAWKRGFHILYEPAAVVHHQVSSTIGKLNRRRVRYVQTRNRLIYHWIHLHDRGLIVSHILWVVVLAAAAIPSLKPEQLIAVFCALARISQISLRRREERLAAVRTDRAVFAVFDDLKDKPGIAPYDTYEERQRISDPAARK